MFKGTIAFLSLIFVTACIRDIKNNNRIEECRLKCQALNASSYSINPNTLQLCQCNIDVE